jgi:hypothetical protein
MAKATSDVPTKPKGQMVREAIDKLLREGRDVTTAALLSLLAAQGLKNAKPMDIYQSSAWKELREMEKSGVAPAPAPAPAPAAKEAPAAASKMANGPTITKTEAIRQALEKLGPDAKPSSVIDFVRKKFNIEPSSQLVSNFKSTLAKKAEAKRGPGRPPKSQAGTPAAAPRPSKASSSGDISLDDLRSVKELVAKMGADKVRQLAQVLA